MLQNIYSENQLQNEKAHGWGHMQKQVKCVK